MDARHTSQRRVGAMTCVGSLSGMRIEAPFGPRDAAILTPDALGFLRTLVREFAGPIRAALITPVPPALERRTVEIGQRASRRAALADGARRSWSDA